MLVLIINLPIIHSVSNVIPLEEFLGTGIRILTFSFMAALTELQLKRLFIEIDYISNI